MKTKQIIVGTTLLIFSPEKFSEYATNAGIEQELRDNKQLREAHPDGKAPPEVVAEWKKHNLDRANTIRNSFLSSLLITFSSIIIGIAIGAGLKYLLGKPSTLITNAIQVFGVGIILSATLSVLGSKIESYKGKTLAEHIDRSLFRWQYILGSLLFFLALSWSA
ncbi:hypothetical protein F3I16_16345 [Pseudomonas sp. L-22-4S-12]|uniref:hypothetical protein n=1 Tax=Pseudomonas sp. L-22-4S-12 TaxID=2610893 RepID=UPI0013238518|nr:hypothetical protein [Pseudomonas sp. L-22-4S-12]MWV17612.1 hypothetical protein [Pseudomonas sp. L-22-4S-12]